MIKSRIPTLSTAKSNITKILVPLFFILSVATLYYFEPASFEESWKGRISYMIFLWILILELAMSWRKLSKKKFTPVRIIALVLALMGPILYITAFFRLGLNSNVIQLGEILGDYTGLEERAGIYTSSFVKFHLPISFEHIVLSFLFTISIWLMYGFNGIRKTSISLFFIWAIGTFYMIDTFYPFNTFTILQSLSPLTTCCAAFVLNVMGYDIKVHNGVVLYDPNVLSRRFPNIEVNWPCSGIHSLIIYTLIIFLFIKNVKFKPLELPINAKRKSVSLIHPVIPGWLFRLISRSYIFLKTNFVLITAFLIGAIGTFLVNVLRIVSIIVIMLKYGMNPAFLFHSYYGELYFLAWILIYPSIIIYAPQIVTYLAHMKFKFKLR